MPAPEGYEKLAVVGIAYKGEYAEGTEYKYLNAVYYNSSTYVALKDGVTSIPYDDGINWKYLAQGFISHNLSELEAIDTEGILGTAGSSVDAQELIDGIADDLKNGDTAENTVTFTSGDSLEAEEWTNVELLESGEKQKTLFNKISNMFKNARYLFNLLGNTDISEIGNGTVTGAISSLNADLANKQSEINNSLNKKLEKVNIKASNAMAQKSKTSLPYTCEFDCLMVVFRLGCDPSVSEVIIRINDVNFISSNSSTVTFGFTLRLNKGDTVTANDIDGISSKTRFTFYATE